MVGYQESGYGDYRVILSYPMILGSITLPALAVGFITYGVSSQVHGDSDIAFHSSILAALLVIVSISIALVIFHGFGFIGL